MTKIDTLKVLEWNINSRSTGATIPDYIPDEILRKNPDVAVLVEFKGEQNEKILRDKLENYNIYVSKSLEQPGENEKNEKNGKNKKTGNQILVALSKNVFPETISNKDIDFGEKYDDDQPNWIRIRTKINEESFDIIAIKVLVGGNDKKDLQSRRKQIEWLLGEYENSSKCIVLGDFNFGPHRTDFEKTDKQGNPLEINWQEIIYLMRKKGFLQSKYICSPYSPVGYSHESLQLDWLIGKRVSVINNSDYNQLDWSFCRFNKKPYVPGQLTLEGYFIRTDPPYPDHAIFTAEIDVL